ncbi:helix-turn-helix transcriptional regulator [Enterococcus sp. AZ109]|uniref:helix-turn-helix transcriptional regulator n=1 Tax=Enterococcus sp. AZ109 TaxID=2774634 RepID=UPI003F208DB6
MNKIVGYRKMLGKTQSEMAKIFNVSTQSYWQKENGKARFSDEEKILFKKMVQDIFPNITIDEIFFS